MPQRTNTFQQIVAVLQRHLAPDAVVEESSMVTPTQGGVEREVDVLIKSTVGGHPVVVAVEASRTGRRATVEWVDRMIGKHADLPIDKLVLYSGSGFTKAAEEKARANNIVAIAAVAVAEDELAESVLGGLLTARPKSLNFVPEMATVWVETDPDGSGLCLEAPFDMPVSLADGRSISLAEAIVQRFDERVVEVTERLGVEEISEPTVLELQLGWNDLTFSVDGNDEQVFLSLGEPADPKLYRIVSLQAKGHVIVDLQRVDLTHTRLGDVLVAHGEYKSRSGDPYLVVVSDASGTEQLTVRMGGKDLQSRPYGRRAQRDQDSVAGSGAEEHDRGKD